MLPEGTQDFEDLQKRSHSQETDSSDGEAVSDEKRRRSVCPPEAPVDLPQGATVESGKEEAPSPTAAHPEEGGTV
ncbi:hypothetical protein MRX96_046216 [Rhipicephalus microplus]